MPIADTISSIVANRQNEIAHKYNSCWQGVEKIITFAEKLNTVIKSDNWKILLRNYPEFKAEWEEIKRKAIEDAENFRNQAHDDAIRTREGAETYAEQVLASLESTLTQHQQLVKNGQIYMEKLRAETNGGYDPLKHNYPQDNSIQEDNFRIE